MRTNQYFFDGLGRRIQHLMPGNQSEGFAYDPAGNLLYRTNFNGIILTNSYDAMNRLTSKSSGGGYNVTFGYSSTGQRLNMVDSIGTSTYIYDVRDRVTTNNAPQGALVYTYDANGNVTGITSSTANGTSVQYQYDALNRLSTVTDARLSGAQSTTYAYDAVGNLHGYAYPNGVTNLYQYDSLNRLTNVLWRSNTLTMASFYYQLGHSGNRTGLIETNHNASQNYGWSYDGLYRMTNESLGSFGNLGYAFDPVGNRTNRSSTVTGLSAQTPTYNTNDWLTSDTYDNNGNTTLSASKPYQYDAEDRLTNFNNGAVAIFYNGDGQRVMKIAGSTTTVYLVDSHNPSGYAQVLEDLSVISGVTNLAKAYTYGPDLISQRQPGISTNFFVYDGHGSTRLLLDIGGTVENAFTYDAYGTLIASNTTPQTAYLYAGQQWDSDLGLYYNRARYLNVGTGRFLNSDVYQGDQTDPLSLHKYLYGWDDPVNGSDPSGHDLDTMIQPVLAGLFNNILNHLEAWGVPAYVAPYRVVVVTPSSGPSYTPLTKVKDDAQVGLLGLPKNTPIRISVPLNVDPQALVDTWAKATVSDNMADFLYYWRPHGPHDYKETVSQIYDAFGNFGFGSTGCAAGFHLNGVNGLVWWGDKAHGIWNGKNDPINTADITSGFNAIKNGGKLSVDVESILPPQNK